MELREGLVVRSKAGRDSGEFFVVVKLEDKYAYIADGKTKRLNKLKKKNRKHLFATHGIIRVDNDCTNKDLRMALKRFKAGKAYS